MPLTIITADYRVVVTRFGQTYWVDIRDKRDTLLETRDYPTLDKAIAEACRLSR